MDNLPDPSKLVEILFQHFDVCSKKMVPGTALIPLTDLVFEDEDNFERDGWDHNNDDKS